MIDLKISSEAKEKVEIAAFSHCIDYLDGNCKLVVQVKEQNILDQEGNVIQEGGAYNLILPFTYEEKKRDDTVMLDHALKEVNKRFESIK